MSVCQLLQYSDEAERLIPMLARLPRRCRAEIFQAVVSLRPQPRLEAEFALGPLRAAFADYWHQWFQVPVPLKELRAVLSPPVPIDTILEFSGLTATQDADEIGFVLGLILKYLQHEVRELKRNPQLLLFGDASTTTDFRPPTEVDTGPSSVESLSQLLSDGYRFPTIYADPPWRYANTSSRAAAEKHYRTLSLDEICAEPVGTLAAENAHLHLWTTNGFLQDAFRVITCWGFEFKSCLVWVKDEMGMGNYWRVSHEYLLLGIRGNLTFRDRMQRSWIQAHRTTHSRKPDLVRSLIERVSPGPYLELYGRKELPDSAWTVYGNQVERRLF